MSQSIFSTYTSSKSSSHILSSSKLLMSNRLMQIQEEVLKRFQKYPSQQREFVKKLFYQNIDNFNTIEQKIGYLKMILYDIDENRLKQYFYTQLKDKQHLLDQTNSSEVHQTSQDLTKNKYKYSQKLQTKHSNQKNKQSDKQQLCTNIYSTMSNPYKAGQTQSMNFDKSQYQKYVQLQKQKHFQSKKASVQSMIQSQIIKKELKKLNMQKKLHKLSKHTFLQQKNSNSQSNLQPNSNIEHLKPNSNIEFRTGSQLKNNQLEGDIFSFRPKAQHLIRNYPYENQFNADYLSQEQIIKRLNKFQTFELNQSPQKSFSTPVSSQSKISLNENKREQQLMRKLQNMQRQRLLLQQHRNLQHKCHRTDEKQPEKQEKPCVKLQTIENSNTKHPVSNKTSKKYICYSQSSSSQPISQQFLPSSSENLYKDQNRQQEINNHSFIKKSIKAKQKQDKYQKNSFQRKPSPQSPSQQTNLRLLQRIKSTPQLVGDILYPKQKSLEKQLNSRYILDAKRKHALAEKIIDRQNQNIKTVKEQMIRLKDKKRNRK